VETLKAAAKTIFVAVLKADKKLFCCASPAMVH